MNKIFNKIIGVFKKPEVIKVITNEDRLISYLETNKERFRVLFDYVPKRNIDDYVVRKYTPLTDNETDLTPVLSLREVKKYQKNKKRLGNPYKEGKVLSPEIKFYMDEIKKAEINHEIQIRESLPDGVTLEDTFKEIMDNIGKVRKK